MATTEIQETDTKPTWRLVSPNSPFKTNLPLRPAHTESEMEKFSKIYERNGTWTQVDVVTQKPVADAKKFFFKITALITECIGANEDDIRITFQVQKYYRNKTYKVQVSPEDSREKEVNVPYSERRANGDLRDTGERMIDADDFLKEFKPDAQD